MATASDLQGDSQEMEQLDTEQCVWKDTYDFLFTQKLLIDSISKTNCC